MTDRETELPEGCTTAAVVGITIFLLLIFVTACAGMLKFICWCWN